MIIISRRWSTNIFRTFRTVGVVIIRRLRIFQSSSFTTSLFTSIACGVFVVVVVVVVIVVVLRCLDGIAVGVHVAFGVGVGVGV